MFFVGVFETEFSYVRFELKSLLPQPSAHWAYNSIPLCWPFVTSSPFLTLLFVFAGARVRGVWSLRHALYNGGVDVWPARCPVSMSLFELCKASTVQVSAGTSLLLSEFNIHTVSDLANGRPSNRLFSFLVFIIFLSALLLSCLMRCLFQEHFGFTLSQPWSQPFICRFLYLLFREWSSFL